MSLNISATTEAIDLKFGIVLYYVGSNIFQSKEKQNFFFLQSGTPDIQLICRKLSYIITTSLTIIVFEISSKNRLRTNFVMQ